MFRTESPMKLKKILESPGITAGSATKDDSIVDNEKNENLEETASSSTALTPMINELKLRQVCLYLSNPTITKGLWFLAVVL